MRKARQHILFKMLFAFLLVSSACEVKAHEITFCGEKIPVDKEFVAQNLMSVIKKQARYINMSSLRKHADRYFPRLEKYLKDHNLPEDLKYLPIVESGFAIRTSSAGAQGFWQLMPKTAEGMGLSISEGYDQRNDFETSTIAACNLLIEYYLQIKKRYNISSWVLTAAAYNFGIGNMSNSISRQGRDYFSMNLNKETAEYVYKIIAIKELFEYPELYIKNFNYNIFSSKPAAVVEDDEPETDKNLFGNLEVNVNEKDGLHPDVTEDKKLMQAEGEVATERRPKLVAAQVKGKYNGFKDGDPIMIELQDNLMVQNRYLSKGNLIKGTGWIINDRVFVDLGFGSSDIILYDSNSQQGIAISSLKNNQPLVLKVKV